jgi:type VII secretion protein EccB
MQSRRDHVQAYQFSVARLVRAAAGGDVASGEPPARRASLGVGIGGVFGGLLCAGMLVYGLISPKPSTAWKSPGAIIVDKATGNRYVYLAGELRPTANYASALLIAGQQATVQMVAGSSLAGIPVGPPIGIPGAPDSVPTASALLPGAWALCLTGGRNAGGSPATVLDLAPTGHTAPLPGRAELLAAESGPGGRTGAEYVIWDGTRYPVTDPAVLPALGLGTRQPIQAPAGWLDQLPTGPAPAPPPVPGAGGSGPVIAGQAGVIGRVYDTDGGGVSQYYVLQADGLAPITATEAALFASVPGSAAPVALSPGQVAAAPASADRSLLDRLPDLLTGTAYPPSGANPQGGPDLCVLQKSPGTPAGSTLVTESASVLAAGPVSVPPDAGMLVESPGAASRAGAGGSALLYLVAGDGRKYPVDAASALGALGYGQAPAHILPDQILALIPTGPVLDVTDATKDTQ